MGAGTGIGNFCAKTILIVTNIFFFLIGLVFFAAGIALKVASKYIQPLIDDLLDNVPQIGAGASLANTGTSNGSIKINVSDLTGNFAIAFIVIGLFIMVVGILGMCGTCCSSKTVLIVYAIIIFILIAVQLIVIIIVATGVLNKQAKDELKKMVKTKYGGIDKFDPETLLLNFIMIHFKCCGIDGWEDFNTTEKWTQERLMNLTQSGVQIQKTVTLVTPVACCMLDADLPKGKPINDQCAITPTDTINNWKKGCFDELTTNIVDKYKWILVGAVTGVLVFELILGILAIVISKTAQTKGQVEAF